MKRFVAIAIISILAVLMGKCGIDRINSTVQQQHARDGWYILLDQLPSLPTFSTINVLIADSHVDYYGTECYYANGYVVLGSSLPQAEALEVYKTAVLSSGWIIPDNPLIDSLHQGENGELLIESQVPPVIEKSINYQSLKNSYNSITFVRLTYILPHRDKC
jgi:hypothetical protein